MKSPSSMLLSECCSPSSTANGAQRTVPVILLRLFAERGRCHPLLAMSCVQNIYCNTPYMPAQYWDGTANITLQNLQACEEQYTSWPNSIPRVARCHCMCSWYVLTAQNRVQKTKGHSTLPAEKSKRYPRPMECPKLFGVTSLCAMSLSADPPMALATSYTTYKQCMCLDCYQKLSNPHRTCDIMSCVCSS